MLFWELNHLEEMKVSLDSRMAHNIFTFSKDEFIHTEYVHSCGLLSGMINYVDLEFQVTKIKSTSLRDT